MNEIPLEDLRHTLTHARLCHEAWWFIEGENAAREGVLRVYNRYKDFFGTVHPALFVTFIVKLCSVFDKDKESISLKVLPEFNVYPGFEDLWQRGRKLFRYRSKAIAHRSLAVTEKDFAAETGFSYNSIKKILDESCDMFDATALRIGIPPTYPFTCTGDLHLMIQDFDERIGDKR
jgi:AbiU2